MMHPGAFLIQWQIGKVRNHFYKHNTKQFKKVMYVKINKLKRLIFDNFIKYSNFGM